VNRSDIDEGRRRPFRECQMYLEIGIAPASLCIRLFCMISLFGRQTLGSVRESNARGDGFASEIG